MAERIASPVVRGLRRYSRHLLIPEVGIAYDTRCVTQVSDPRPGISARAYRDALALGMLVARPGIGFPAQVHLERFGSPEDAGLRALGAMNFGVPKRVRFDEELRTRSRRDLLHLVIGQEPRGWRLVGPSRS